MADDILKIGAIIDLSQIVPGMDKMASAAEGTASRMKTAFEGTAGPIPISGREDRAVVKDPSLEQAKKDAAEYAAICAENAVLDKEYQAARIARAQQVAEAEAATSAKRRTQATADQSIESALRAQMAASGQTMAQVLRGQGRSLEDVQGAYKSYGMTGKAASLEVSQAFGISSTRVMTDATKSRMALMGMGQEMGVAMPRFVRSMIGSIGPVGSIMAAAFMPIAIIGMLQYLAKVPEAIKKMTDSIMGYGEAQKKAFEETIKSSDEALTHFDNINSAISALLFKNYLSFSLDSFKLSKAILN